MFKGFFEAFAFWRNSTESNTIDANFLVDLFSIDTKTCWVHNKRFYTVNRRCYSDIMFVKSYSEMIKIYDHWIIE